VSEEQGQEEGWAGETGTKEKGTGASEQQGRQEGRRTGQGQGRQRQKQAKIGRDSREAELGVAAAGSLIFNNKSINYLILL
jgi:hypothetical protein